LLLHPLEKGKKKEKNASRKKFQKNEGRSRRGRLNQLQRARKDARQKNIDFIYSSAEKKGKKKRPQPDKVHFGKKAKFH